jgi:DNA repair protein SbcD/Mre11
MRFLHTGDWHVGRTIRGKTRFDEFAAALDEVVGIARDEGVDAVLVAGDIYDRRAVTPDADRLILETLLRLSDIGVAVVALPGNHDSAARLEAFSPLLERFGVHLVCRMIPPDDGGMLEIASRDNAQRARIACMPFVSPRRFSDAAQLFDNTAAGYVDFDEGMGKLLEAYAGAFGDRAINMIVGHAFIHGAQPGGSERQVTIGGDYAVSPARLPGTANYVALGHIHKPQAIRGAPCPARYCGSLIQLDFGERGQDKSVVIVEAAPGQKAKTRTVPLTAGRALRDIEGTLEELGRSAAEVGDAYLRVTVKVDGPTPGIGDDVRKFLPNALEVRLEYEREIDDPPKILEGLSPLEQFVAYHQQRHGVEPTRELLSAFDHVYDEVTS